MIKQNGYDVVTSEFKNGKISFVDNVYIEPKKYSKEEELLREIFGKNSIYDVLVWYEGRPTYEDNVYVVATRDPLDFSDIEEIEDFTEWFIDNKHIDRSKLRYATVRKHK